MADELLRLAQDAVESCAADQAEAVAFQDMAAVTRFANNTIHQSMVEHSRGLTVRAVLGKRIGCASGTVQGPDDARRIAAQAAELAPLARELPDFLSLPAPQPLPEAPPTVAQDVLRSTPASRAALVGAALAEAGRRNLTAAGALTVRDETLAVANSLGVAAAHQFTRAHFHIVMQGEDSAGYAAAGGQALADTHVEATANRAAQKALRGRNPRHVEAKPMPVVLEPVAAAELLSFFSWGFSALAFQEQRSFVCDTLGRQACAACFTLTDDGLDPRTHVRPFDFEGMPAQRVELVRNGVVSALVHDSYTAGRASESRGSTGHATPPPGRGGPVPMNVIVTPGDSSLEDLVEMVDRGLLVSRVHYLNFAHPRKMILTGMTREGTFLIEDGQIAAGVHNLRFTERFVEGLSRLAAVGRQGQLHETVWTPPLLIDGFSFTSETEF